MPKVWGILGTKSPKIVEFRVGDRDKNFGEFANSSIYYTCTKYINVSIKLNKINPFEEKNCQSLKLDALNHVFEHHKETTVPGATIAW